jgi:hypothetical protein
VKGEVQRSFDFALTSLRSVRPSLRMTKTVKVIDDRGIESLKIVEVKANA